MPPGCVGFSSVFDCGVEPYRSHLLNQLNTVMDQLAEHSGGIVIDRWDFAGLTNPRADDGITAYVNPPSVKTAKPVGSTTLSLLHFMRDVHKVVHTKHNRAVSINDHTYRIDLLEHVDHAGDEHGGAPARAHAGALAFMSKSIGLHRPPQELLYWGTQASAGSSAAMWQAGDAPFGQSAIDYAPLFAQLVGRRWAGEAHAVRVTSGGPAQANLFVIDPRSGPTSKDTHNDAGTKAGPLVRVLVVALGPARGNVSVELRGSVEYGTVAVYHPAVSAPMSLPAPTSAGNVTKLTVPLSHGDPTGCAVVRLTPRLKTTDDAMHAEGNIAPTGSVNLLRNGGFETGPTAWGVRCEFWEEYSKFATPAQLDLRSSWSVDTDSAAAGERSLRVTLAPTPGLLKRPVPGAEVMSEYFVAPANGTLTYSVSLRASRPVNATLVLRFQPPMPGCPLGELIMPKLERSFMLTPEWQRYSLAVDRLPGSRNNAYAAGLVVENAQTVDVWMDSARVDPGRSAEYVPHSEIEVSGHVGDQNSLIDPGAAAVAHTALRNNRAEDATLVLETTVLGPGYQRVFHSSEEVVVRANSTAFRWPSVPTGLLGPHRVYITVTDAAAKREVASDRFSFGIQSPSAPAAKPNPRSRFGVNVEASTNFSHTLALARRAGFGHTRLMATGFLWNHFEPTPGVWDSDNEQAMHAYVDLSRSYGMAPIALIGRGIPSWAQDGEHPNGPHHGAPAGGGGSAPPSAEHLQEYGKYLTRLAASFGDKLTAYNTWNEPDGNRSGIRARRGRWPRSSCFSTQL